MSTLWIHGTAIFERSCIASRNIGAETTKGWWIFKRTEQEMETKPLLERTCVEFKSLKIDIDYDLLKEVCLKSDANSLFDFISSESFSLFLNAFAGDGMNRCDELVLSSPWNGFDGGPFDGMLNMILAAEDEDDFYSTCEHGEYPEEEQEFLASISPDNFEIVLRDEFFLDENEERFPLDTSADWEILQQGSALVRGGYFYEEPPKFIKFSADNELNVKVYMQGIDSNPVDERSLFEQI